jgi:uncharacterized protein
MGLLTPDRYYSSIQAIDLDELRQSGVCALLVDLDNTLLPHHTNEMTTELRDWAAHVLEHGFRMCIVSNNWHERVHAVAEDLGIDLVPRAVKPFPFAFRRAMRLLDVAPAQCAVVGDQLFTDILGGNLIGATTVLVLPLSTTDLPHTVLLRLIEARILTDREPTA